MSGSQVAKNETPAIEAARRMPTLDHYHKGRPFSIEERDVAQWLCDQPEIRQFVFNWCKRNAAIFYIDGKWIGAQTYSELKE